ncbi:hypothetical protein P9112_005474 [Eukaryota sp. TZLM1-RC]
MSIASPLHIEKHCQSILRLAQSHDSMAACITEQLRASSVYWAVTSLRLMKQSHLIPENSSQLSKSSLVQFTLSCYSESGGFGGNIGHDPHLLYTLSSLQILLLFDSISSLSEVQINKTTSFVLSLQQPDGSFMGDRWGEIDSRFSYCAVYSLALLGKLFLLDKDVTISYIKSCRNYDGGFGCVPGGESHAGQVFCCIGSLSILCSLSSLTQKEVEQTAWWLAERQDSTGGLCGRPMKKSDVCYSWWVVSSLSMIGKVDWIDEGRLIEFILDCQDAEDGGISDRPGNMADMFHTFFGISGLSLLGLEGLEQVDATYALPVSCVEKAGLEKENL